MPFKLRSMPRTGLIIAHDTSYSSLNKAYTAAALLCWIDPHVLVRKQNEITRLVSDWQVLVLTSQRKQLRSSLPHLLQIMSALNIFIDR